MGEVIFWACFAAVAFNFFGYILFLFVLKILRPLPTPGLETVPEDQLPDLWVLVPSFNERAFLRAKLENLLVQQYPAENLRIVVCDGGSTDGSLESIADLATPASNVQLLRCSQKGKVAQLNEGLALVPAKAIVAVSDADALLVGNGAFRYAISCLGDPGIGLVGAWGVPDPHGAPVLEQAYWDKQNRLRLLESQACTSSIVTAQFYLFRRPLIPAFPADCVADDVFAAFRAHGLGQRVIYAPEMEAIELRQPKHVPELMKHKFRKAHAYTVELLRHLYLVPAMRKRTRFLFLFKLFQFFYLPWIMVIFALSMLSRALVGRWDSIAGAVTTLFLGTLLASALLRPPPSRTRGGLAVSSAFHTVVVFALVNLVLMANSLSFPFWKQSSSYPKVGGK